MHFPNFFEEFKNCNCNRPEESDAGLTLQFEFCASRSTSFFRIVPGQRRFKIRERRHSDLRRRLDVLLNTTHRGAYHMPLGVCSDCTVCFPIGRRGRSGNVTEALNEIIRRIEPQTLGNLPDGDRRGFQQYLRPLNLRVADIGTDGYGRDFC